MNPQHLLEQAERLAKTGKGRPRQTDLRRAVSSAYYAIFHLLTQECSRRLAIQASIRPIIARAFDHGQMKQACSVFANKQLPENLKSIVPSILSSSDLQLVAKAFVKLQESRHRADYDTRSNRGFTRHDADAEIRRARVAFETWERIRNEDAAGLFLLALLFHGRWGR